MICQVVDQQSYKSADLYPRADPQTHAVKQNKAQGLHFCC